MITTDRWNELFEIANHERPMELLTDEETVELRNITQTLAAIDSAWMIDGQPVPADAVKAKLREHGHELPNHN